MLTTPIQDQGRTSPDTRKTNSDIDETTDGVLVVYPTRETQECHETGSLAERALNRFKSVASLSALTFFGIPDLEQEVILLKTRISSLEKECEEINEISQNTLECDSTEVKKSLNKLGIDTRDYDALLSEVEEKRQEFNRLKNEMEECEREETLKVLEQRLENYTKEVAEAASRLATSNDPCVMVNPIDSELINKVASLQKLQLQCQRLEHELSVKEMDLDTYFQKKLEQEICEAKKNLAVSEAVHTFVSKNFSHNSIFMDSGKLFKKQRVDSFYKLMQGHEDLKKVPLIKTFFTYLNATSDTNVSPPPNSLFGKMNRLINSGIKKSQASFNIVKGCTKALLGKTDGNITVLPLVLNCYVVTAYSTLAGILYLAPPELSMRNVAMLSSLIPIGAATADAAVQTRDTTKCPFLKGLFSLVVPKQRSNILDILGMLNREITKQAFPIRPKETFFELGKQINQTLTRCVRAIRSRTVSIMDETGPVQKISERIEEMHGLLTPAVGALASSKLFFPGTSDVQTTVVFALLAYVTNSGTE